jgi:hypothetical protein
MRKYRLVSLIIGLSFFLICASGSNRTKAKVAAVSLTVSNPYCTQSAPASSTCLIKVSSINATSTDPNFRGVQITVDGKPRAFFSNFFETSVSINERMMGKGLQVVCGKPNASGVPGYGLQYHVGISAVVSGSSSTSDTANVNCPSYEDRLYLPAVTK